MGFRARICDQFEIAGKGVVFSMTDVSGVPQSGDVFDCDPVRGKVLEINDQSVRDTSCLTGKNVSPYCAILVDVALGVIPHNSIIASAEWNDDV